MFLTFGFSTFVSLCNVSSSHIILMALLPAVFLPNYNYLLDRCVAVVPLL